MPAKTILGVKVFEHAREGMASSFDGRSKDRGPTRLYLTHVEQLDDIICTKYTIKKTAS